MQIEYITRVSFTTWGTSEKQRHLTVSDGLLGKIVIDDKTVHSIITEVFSNSAARVRSQELEGSGIRGSSSDDNGVLKCITFAEETHNVGNSRSLLTDSDVDAEKRLCGVTCFMGSFLVEDRVNSNGGLTSLTISDNQFTLTTADRNL